MPAYNCSPSFNWEANIDKATIAKFQRAIGSMNFHKLVGGSAQVQGPFKSRSEVEDAWRTVSEEHRHKAGVRFSIVEEPSRAVA